MVWFVADGEGPRRVDTMSDCRTVSIVINNYNYGRFLAQAIDSALAQTYPHIEVVVVEMADRKP